MATSHAPHRITVDEYRRMADGGVFDPDARLELIDGTLIEPVAAMKAPHANAVRALNTALTAAFGEVAVICCHLPITLGDASESQPDFAIVRGPSSRYKERHPAAVEVFALIEVSDTSRMYDLTRKLPLYAKHAIPEVWIVDLIDRCIRVFRDPSGTEYRDRLVLAHDEPQSFAAFPSLTLNGADAF